jgi:aminopeptidase-like protein
MKLLNKLYKINRTLLSDDNDSALKILQNEIPIKIHKFKSGTKCFDWKIPKKWKVNKGILKNSHGQVIVNSDENILHLINYSSSYSGKINFNELKKHLHYDKNLPNAIPYRTSYYSDNWGFCLSYNNFLELKDKYYYVEIDTDFEEGDLLIGEAIIRGKSNREVILSSYYCHPNQINDGLSGIILLTNLYSKLKDFKLKYTYRFFFWPETIGTLTALSQGLINPDNVEYALVSTTVGYGDKVHYKKTYYGNHSLDNIIEDCIENAIIKDYNPTGSDERQFSSNGIRIPTGVLTRTPYQEFKEYHTSADNLQFIKISNINNMVNIYSKMIMEYEKYSKYKITTLGGEPFLGKHNLYRSISVPGHSDSDILRNWVIHYCDGNKNVKDISKILNISEKVVEEIVNILLKFKIVREVV